MMKKTKLFLASLMVLFIAACSSMYDTAVNYDKNNAIDTSNYKTFAWLSETKILMPSGDVNPVMKLRIDQEVEQAFIARGYQLIDNPDTADFTISYTVGSREKISVNSYPSTYGAGMNAGWGRGYYGGYYGGYGYGGTETSVRTYTEGKFAIDIFDVKTHQPVWHGAGVKNISASDRKDTGQAIKLIVNNVISQFK